MQLELSHRLRSGKHNDTWLGSWGTRPAIVKSVRIERRHEPALRRRLAREQQVLARVHSLGSHPNIVRVLWSQGLAAGDQEGAPSLALELVQGESLRELLARERSLATDRWCNLAADLASALRRVHECGFVHTDVKPGNVMVARDRFVLVDFDLARPAGPVRPGVGTRLYAAPEQAAGERATPASDAWSLGALLWRAAAGRHPFHGLPHQPQLVLRAPALATASSHLPPHLAALVDALLEPEPHARPDLAEVEAAVAYGFGTPV